MMMICDDHDTGYSYDDNDYNQVSSLGNEVFNDDDVDDDEDDLD